MSIQSRAYVFALITVLLWSAVATAFKISLHELNKIYLTPFLSMIIIHEVLHEKLLYTSVIGLCMITAGILVGRIKYAKR